MDEPGELRFLARGQIGMHDAPRRGLVELLGREVVLRTELVKASFLGDRYELFDLRLDGAFGGAVAQPALLVLAEPFLGTSRMRHRFTPFAALVIRKRYYTRH